MPIGFIFWLIMIIGLVLAIMGYGPVWAVPIVLFVLVGLLGWKTFGFPFKADMLYGPALSSDSVPAPMPRPEAPAPNPVHLALARQVQCGGAGAEDHLSGL